MFGVQKGTVVLLGNVLPETRGNATGIDGPLATQVDEDRRAIHKVFVVDVNALGIEREIVRESYP